jgi:hypothetical protein
VIFLRFKIETLEYYFAKHLINKGIRRGIQIPLSPQKSQKSYVFGVLFFMMQIKIYIYEDMLLLIILKDQIKFNTDVPIFE